MTRPPTRSSRPQSNYQSVADHVVYDPPAWYSGSGSDLEGFVGGAVGALMLGTVTPAEAYEELHSALETLSRETVPV